MAKLAYPGYNPTIEIELVDPVLGTPDSIQQDVRVYRSMSGNVRTLVDHSQLTETVLRFEGLKPSERDNLISFFNSARGKYLRYTDDRGEWIIILKNPEINFEYAPGNGLGERAGQYSFELDVNRFVAPVIEEEE